MKKMEQIALAIVRAGRIAQKTQDCIIIAKIEKAVKAFFGENYYVFVADSFRVRDGDNRPCSRDVESLVTGHTIGTVIFFERRGVEFCERRKEAIFCRRNFPVLKKVILITDEEETSLYADRIIVVNAKDVGDDFVERFIV